MNITKHQKATIYNMDKNGQAVTCLFNPNEYSFSKQNSWTIDQTKGANVPCIEFGSGQPATLQMQLFFDTYMDNESGGSAVDVRRVYTDKLWELMMVDPSLKDPKSQLGRPPYVRFQWGSTWSFEAVITNLSQRFTLFAADGTPLRAVCDVTFQQIRDERTLSPQNPTSAGEGGERLWTVSQGDTLGWIAYKSYGDAKRWRPIADVNGLTNVRDLAPGTTLMIPNA